MNSRRPGATALLLGATSILFSVAACSSDGEESAPTSAVVATTSSLPGSTIADTPPSASNDTASSGTQPLEPADLQAELTFAYPAAPGSLEPLNPTASDTFLLPMYDRLTLIDNDYAVQPMLATSWTFSADGTSLDFVLRDGVEFHDGTPFDAQAVKTNLERMKGDGSPAAGELASITDIEVVEPQLVRLHLSGGGVDLPLALGSRAGMMVSPQAIAASSDFDDPATNAGSGAYKLESFTPGDKVSFVRWDGPYWDPTAGRLARLTMVGVPSGAQRLNALQAGDIDIALMSLADFVAARELAGQPGFSGTEVPLLAQYGIVLSPTSKGPLSNQTFRQALNFAIDKDSLNRDLLQGTCTPASQFFTESHWAHSTAVDAVYSHDTERAEQLVTESGVTDTHFTLGATPDKVELATAIQGQLQAAGIDVEVVPLQATETSGAMFRAGQIDAQFLTVGPQPDPNSLVSRFYLGGYSTIADGDGSFAALAEAGASPTKTQEERKRVYDELWLKVANYSPVIEICVPSNIYLQREAKPANMGDLYLAWSGRPDLRALYVADT